MYEEDVMFGSIAHGAVHGRFLRGSALAETHIDNGGAVVNCINNGIGHVFVVLVAIGHGAHRHDAHVIGYTVDAGIIAASCADNACHMGAVFCIGALHVIVAVEAFVYIGVVVAYDMARVEAGIVVVMILVVHLFIVFIQVSFNFTETCAAVAHNAHRYASGARDGGFIAFNFGDILHRYFKKVFVKALG